jgi:hypothetical protein
MLTFCDVCGRDITEHLHPGHAHVRTPLGPTRYVCLCGQMYPSGAIEWDDLSGWDKRQRLADVGLAAIASALLVAFVVVVYFAVTIRSVRLFVFVGVVLLFSFPLFPLLIAVLKPPFEIAASIWRTRIASRRIKADVRN